MTVRPVLARPHAAVAAFGALLLAVPAQGAPIAVPVPSDQPQKIIAATDGFLAALAQRSSDAAFQAELAAAAADLPVLGERAADVASAEAGRSQARSRLFPALGIDFVGARTITRDLQSPSTQVENLVPLRRNDVIGSVDQLVTDFGATSARIRAGSATSDAARAELDAARNTALLQLVEAWYGVLEAQTAASMVQSHVDRMQTLAVGANARFERGVDSGGDVARAQSYLAAAKSQQISVDRSLRSAEARFVELFGRAPAVLSRPAIGGNPPASMPGDTLVRPEVVAARAAAAVAGAELDAARSDRLPRVDARVSGSAYDVLRGTTPAYDVRAQLTLRQRFSVGGAEVARVAELAARRRSAALAVDRIGAATDREYSTAIVDVEGLEASLVPLQSAYIDSRRARDLFAEQFRVLRGNLFDILRAERDVFEAALALARASYDLDVARYTLLARQGGLIEHFGITPAVVATYSEPSR